MHSLHSLCQCVTLATTVAVGICVIFISNGYKFHIDNPQILSASASPDYFILGSNKDLSFPLNSCHEHFVAITPDCIHDSKQQAVMQGCVNLNYSSSHLPLTALASYPGSGNTWVRHLIQQLTGK